MRCVWGNCDQEANESGLCYYHRKRGRGLIDGYDYEQPSARVRALIEELRKEAR